MHRNENNDEILGVRNNVTLHVRQCESSFNLKNG